MDLLMIERKRNWEREINRYGVRRIDYPWTEGDNGREPVGSLGKGDRGGGASLQGWAGEAEPEGARDCGSGSPSEAGPCPIHPPHHECG